MPIDIVACTQINDAKLMGRYLEYAQNNQDQSGTVITSSGGPIHVWSGNNDASSQKSQEQLNSVQQWGMPDSANQYHYVVVGISDSTNG